MKVIEEKFQGQIENEERKLLNDNTMFLDIETTGFSRTSCHIYMIGLAFLQENEMRIALLFAEDTSEEILILEKFIELIKNTNKFISFNGLAFDFPFIEEKCKHYSLDFNANDYSHTDIYKDCKCLKKLLDLENVKQKTIESFLNIGRNDIYNGGQLIKIYHNYSKDRNIDDYNKLICHNLEDVAGMVNILTIYRYIEIIKILPKIDTITQNSPKNVNSEINFVNYELKAEYKLNYNLPTDFSIKSEFYYIVFRNNKIKILLLPQHKKLNYYLTNYKDYAYIPSEDIIVPKQLLNASNKKEAVNATQKNCYIASESYYLPIYDHSLFEDNRIFKDDYSSKEEFIRFDPENIDVKFYDVYIKHIISHYMK